MSLDGIDRGAFIQSSHVSDDHPTCLFQRKLSRISPTPAITFQPTLSNLSLTAPVFKIFFDDLSKKIQFRRTRIIPRPNFATSFIFMVFHIPNFPCFFCNPLDFFKDSITSSRYSKFLLIRIFLVISDPSVDLNLVVLDNAAQCRSYQPA